MFANMMIREERVKMLRFYYFELIAGVMHLDKVREN